MRARIPLQYLPRFLEQKISHGLRRLIRGVLFATPTQPFLRNTPPKDLTLSTRFPAELLPRKAERGAEWMNGNLTLAGASITGEKANPFDIKPPTKEWRASLHSFSWLTHLSALNNIEGDRAMADAVFYWMGTQTSSFRNRTAWQGDVAAMRFIHLCAAAPHILKLHTDKQKQELMNSLSLHAHFLQKTAHLEPDGLPRLTAICGHAYSAFALSDGISRLHPAMAQLDHELARQVLDDGVHVSRAPNALMPVLPILIAIKNEMERRDLPMPTNFATKLSRILNSISFFLHGDQQFAVFNGSTETDIAGATKADYIKKLLVAGGNKRRTQHSFMNASHYHRLSVGKSLLFLDGGVSELVTTSPLGHIAPLALEFSRGTHRLIVNCGPNLVHGLEWRQASRLPPAHSLLSLSGNEAIAALNTSLAVKPFVSAKLLENETGHWLESSHQMFKASTGFTVHRRLYLSASGEDLRVEESLLPDTSGKTKATDFTLRLHLHPKVKGSSSGDGKTILLVLPNGEGWQFRRRSSDYGELCLVPSVYMGADGRPRKCQQIVISGRAPENGLTFIWAMQLMKKA